MQSDRRGNQLGAYILGPRFRDTEDTGRIYRAHHVETGAPALVLQRTARQADEQPLADWEVRVTSSVSPAFVALEVLSAPEAGLPADAAEEFVVMLGDAEQLANAVVDRPETLPHLRAAPRPSPAPQVVTPHPLPLAYPSWRRPALAAGLSALAAAALLHLGDSGAGLELQHDVGTASARVDVDGGWGGDDAATGLVLTSTTDDAPFVLARALPKKPFTNQKRAPCNPDIEVEIRGGCWVRLKQDAPCKGDTAYEYDGGCYLPAAKPESAPAAFMRQPLAFDQP